MDSGARVGSLFTGYCGLDLAVERAFGARTVWHVENDKAASAVLASHWPEIPNYGDVAETDWSSVEPVEIVTGGYPCFTGGTLVLTREGYTPIRDIRVGDMVLTHQRRWRPVTALMNKLAHESVVVRAQGSPPVQCTTDHPWWTREGDWVPAKDLAGRHVVHVLPESEPGIDLPAAAAWLLGRYLAGGHASETGGHALLTIACDSSEAPEIIDMAGRAGCEAVPSGAGETIMITASADCAGLHGVAVQCGSWGLPGRLIAEITADQAEQILEGFRAGAGTASGPYVAWALGQGLACSLALLAQKARGVAGTVEAGVASGEVASQAAHGRWRIALPSAAGGVAVPERAQLYSPATVESGPAATVYNIAVDEDESYVVGGSVVHNCQPFSSSGRREGAGDDRHMWPYVVEAMIELRPKIAVFENVLGHLTLGFNEVLRDLTKIGYDAQWVVVKASDVGACHIRQRLFILAQDTRRPVTRDAGQFPEALAVAVLEGKEWMTPSDGLFGAMPFTDRFPRAGALRSGTIYDLGEYGKPGLDRFLQGVPAPMGPVESLPTPHAPRSSVDPQVYVPAVPGRGPRTDLAVIVDNGLLAAGLGSSHGGGVRTQIGTRGAAAGAAGKVKHLPTPRASEASDSMGSKGAERHVAAGCGTLTETLGVVLHGEGLPEMQAAAAQYQLWAAEGSAPAEVGGAVLTMLPTPVASSARRRDGEAERTRRSPNLVAVSHFFPHAIAAGSAGHETFAGQVFAGIEAGEVVHEQESGDTDWGPYADGIRRQEAVTGVKAPAPTELNRNGNPRLAVRFAEWMMMVPPGWVTDLVRPQGVSKAQAPELISYADALKAIGNGVVPPQALLAIMITRSIARWSGAW